MSFADSLKRLRAAVESPDERMRGRRPEEAVVGVRDLFELLRDYDRLDAEHRKLYPPHLTQMHEAMTKFCAASEELDAALQRFAPGSRIEVEPQMKTSPWRLRG